MSEWLDLMLDEISRKRAEATEAAEEARRRSAATEENGAALSGPVEKVILKTTVRGDTHS